MGTCDEISEVLTSARQSREKKHCKKPTNEIVKMEILNLWKNKMKKEERRADNLSVAVAQKIWNDKIKIKVLGSKTYEPRAQFSISWREISNRAENEEQNNKSVPKREERNSPRMLLDLDDGDNEDGKNCYK